MLTRLSVVLAVASVLGGCGEDRIEVHPTASTDYNEKALAEAVDQFVTAGRTPEAYADLAKAVLSLRPGMDRTVAGEAELKLVVLALGPIRSVQAKSNVEQIDALALTVWPTLLTPAIE